MKPIHKFIINQTICTNSQKKKMNKQINIFKMQKKIL